MSDSSSLSQELERLSAQPPFNLSHFHWVEDSEHPAWSALHCAFVDRLNAVVLETIRAAVVEPAADDDPTAIDERLKSALGDLDELQGWVFTPKLPMTRSQADALLGPLVEHGIDIQFAVGIRDSVQRRIVGPPSWRRQLYVDAFERMLLLDESLGTVVQKLCRCDDKSHPKCRGRFHTGIGIVKKLLRKYARELVSAYDKLHPDRAAKHKNPSKVNG